MNNIKKEINKNLDSYCLYLGASANNPHRDIELDEFEDFVKKHADLTGYTLSIVFGLYKGKRVRSYRLEIFDTNYATVCALACLYVKEYNQESVIVSEINSISISIENNCC